MYFLVLFTLFSILIQGSSVVSLTVENFDAILSKGKVFVKYFSPGCQHCIAVAPTYEQVGKEFNTKYADKITIAEVDCTTSRDLCNQAGVRGYPTFRFYKSGKTDFDEYKGDRSMNSFSEFLSTRIGVFYKPPVTKTRTLTPDDFDSVVYNTKLNVLVAFIASWCGHCRSLKPEFETAAQAFKDSDNVICAIIDADAYKDFTRKYNIHSYPTIKFFPATKTNEVVLTDSQKTGLYKGNQAVVPYDQGRSAGDIIRYLNTQSGTFRDVKGGIEEKAGLEQSLVQPIKSLVGQLASTTPNPAEITTLMASLNVSISNMQNKYVGTQYARYLNEITGPKGLDFARTEHTRLNTILLSKNYNDRLAFELTVRRNVLGLFL